MYQNLSFVQIHVKNALLDRWEQIFLSILSRNHIDVVGACLKNILYRSELLSLVSHHSKADEIYDKVFIRR